MTEDATTLATAEGCSEFPPVGRRMVALRGGIPAMRGGAPWSMPPTALHSAANTRRTVLKTTDEGEICGAAHFPGKTAKEWGRMADPSEIDASHDQDPCEKRWWGFPIGATR